MIIKKISECKYSRVLDETLLCEFLHPQNDSNLKMNCSIAHAILEPGMSSRSHRLHKSSEIYFILEGKGIMHIGEEKEILNHGEAVYIPPGAVQWIENNSDQELKFLCIVSPPWSNEDDELCP